MADAKPDNPRKAVDHAVKATFPRAQKTTAYGLDGWRVELDKAMVPRKIGTMDPTSILILLRQGKSGVTLHLWNPLDFQVIQRHARGLKAAGLEPMVGCIRYTRKGPYPIDAIRPILEDVRATLEAATQKRGRAR